MTDKAKPEEIELDIVEVVRTDGRVERISMVLEVNDERAELSPLDEVEDLADDSAVELIAEPAVSGVLKRPPILGQDDHPFVPAPAAINATEAWNRLRVLEWWTGYEPAVERLLGVSRHTVTRAYLRILSDMIHYGLACDDALLERAVAVGLSPSLARVIDTLLRRFSATTSAPGWGGLTEEQVRANWAALGVLAKRHNVVFANQGGRTGA